MRLDATIALAGADPGDRRESYTSYTKESGLPPFSPSLIHGNKWARRAPTGLDGKLIDFGRASRSPCAIWSGISGLRPTRRSDRASDRAKPSPASAGSSKNGNGRNRQLRVFKETGDLTKVVDYIIEETEIVGILGCGSGSLNSTPFDPEFPRRTQRRERLPTHFKRREGALITDNRALLPRNAASIRRRAR